MRSGSPPAAGFGRRVAFRRSTPYPPAVTPGGTGGTAGVSRIPEAQVIFDSSTGHPHDGETGGTPVGLGGELSGTNVEAVVARPAILELMSGWTPYRTGPDDYSKLVPHGPEDAVLVFDVKRLNFRREAHGGLAASVVVEKSTGGGAFSAVTVGTVNHGTSDLEADVTAALGTVSSGDRLRANVATTGGNAWTVAIEIERPAD